MHFHHYSLRAALLAAAFLSLLAPRASAQGYYTAGHGDLGIEYEAGSGEFEAHWHLGAGAVVDGVELSTDDEFAPDEIIGWLNSTSTVSSASVASALGVSTGTTVFRTGITAYPPNVGFALEEVGAPGDWTDGTITLSLAAVSGPGEVAISQTISGIGTLVWFSSVDAGLTSSGNAWSFGVGLHQHLDWFFTEAGFYELTFEWAGEHAIDGLVTGTGTFGFQVGAIPEPSTYAAFFGAAALGLALWQRRRRTIA